MSEIAVLITALAGILTPTFTLVGFLVKALLDESRENRKSIDGLTAAVVKYTEAATISLKNGKQA